MAASAVLLDAGTCMLVSMMESMMDYAVHEAVLFDCTLITETR